MDNTLIISDLHAGSPLFRHQLLLTNLINDSKYKRIIVVGDIIDTWEDDVDDIINCKIVPIEALRNTTKELYIIRGNHDPSIEELGRIFPNAAVIPYSLIIDGVVFVHGHEFDSLVMEYSRLALFLHHFHWLFQRMGINLKAFFRELFYSVAAKRSSRYYNDLVYDIMEKVILKYGKYGDTVVTGHTHMPMIANHIRHPGIKYVNCGDWVHNFSYVELIDGEFKLTKLS